MGYGFFEEDQFEKVEFSKNAKCGSCGLYKRCITPKMKPTGKGKLKILFVAEAPGKKEDLKGVQLIGKSGKRLRKELKLFNINLDDCRKINAVNCRPKANKTPENKQIDFCRPNVKKEIERFKPNLIITLGMPALRSVIGDRWTKNIGALEKWRGWSIPDQDLNAWVCPTYHPAYVLRRENEVPIDLIWSKDLKNFLSLRDRPVPKLKDKSKLVKILTEKESIIWLKRLLKIKPPLIAIDYETTGLKPHAKGHRIVSASLCWNKNFSISFMMSKKIEKYFNKILLSRSFGKIAANMKFEEIWSREKLNVKIRNWIWDTMLCSHVLDNRSKATSLKFQTYINYGLVDYDSHISPYLEADSKNANSFNKIYKLDNHDLLLYNGLDTYFEFCIAMRQMLAMGIIDQKNFSRKGIVNVKDIQSIFENMEE